ncbi:MAG: hypothetical protein V8R80_07465 [Eubacterium sp.]
MTPAQTPKSTPFWLYYIWAIVISAVGLALVSQARGIAVQVGPSKPPRADCDRSWTGVHF